MKFPPRIKSLRGRIWVRLVWAALTAIGCSDQNLDGGSDYPGGPLPVDQRNPVILSNDSARDNWYGEYALALANVNQLRVEGLIVNASTYHKSLDTNLKEWQDLTNAARASGMQSVPIPLVSNVVSLVRPDNGAVDATVPNGSAGAMFIVESAHRLSQPARPLVIATGGRLTDVADAYLLDHTLSDSVVVVASLGQLASDGQSAILGPPNGEVDYWANEIVIQKMRYVQVNAYYAQDQEVTPNVAAQLPANAFGDWMRSKVRDISTIQTATDQVSISALALPAFTLAVLRMSESGTPLAAQAPILRADGKGRAWVVTRGDNVMAAATVLKALTGPTSH